MDLQLEMQARLATFFSRRKSDSGEPVAEVLAWGHAGALSLLSDRKGFNRVHTHTYTHVDNKTLLACET